MIWKIEFRPAIFLYPPFDFLTNEQKKTMKKTLLLMLSLLVFAGVQLNAQDAPETTEGWDMGGSVGFDFTQLGLVNPRVGAGSNRIGFGGLNTLFAHYRKGKLSWDNDGSLQLSVQRIGSSENPFEKNIDILRLGSILGYQFGDSKLSGAVAATFESLLLPTYEGNVLSGPDSTILAKFLSPARISLSPGLTYKPNEHFVIFYSPVSSRIIYVADDAIAQLNVHGNEPGTNSFYNLGSNLNVTYTNKFLSDKLLVGSSLDLYSNYLKNPQNIDVLWKVDLGWQMLKNISLNLSTELFYDHDILVQVDRNKDGKYDPDELGRRVSFVEALLIKYSYVF